MGSDVERLRARVLELETRVAARRAATASAAPPRPHWLLFAPLAIVFVVGFTVPFQTDAPPPTTTAAPTRAVGRAATEAATARCEETTTDVRRRTEHCTEIVEDLGSAP